MQFCNDCERYQYPSQEICKICLYDNLTWRQPRNEGVIINQVCLYNSLWEFFKRRIAERPWPIASVKMNEGPVVFSHLDIDSFQQNKVGALTSGTKVILFTHYDPAMRSVLIATSPSVKIDAASARRDIAARMGLGSSATRYGGI